MRVPKAFDGTRSFAAWSTVGMACLALAASPALAATGTVPAGVAAPLVRQLKNRASLPIANPADVSSIAAIVNAFDQTISAGPGKTLDRSRLRSLFVPDGRMAIGVPPQPDRAADVVFVTPDAYADLSDSMTKSKGFFDRVIANTVEPFGIMAHVESAYESRFAPDDAQPFTRGVKSFELLNSGDRWYILQVFYDRERTGNSIPKELLRGG